MTMKGISISNAAYPNRYLYNGGTELNNDFNISLYETPNRGYDAQIGRFMQIDALAEKYMGTNPYQFGFNNPVQMNDPSGLDPYLGNTTFGNDRFNTEIDNTISWLDWQKNTLDRAEQERNEYAWSKVFDGVLNFISSLPDLNYMYVNFDYTSANSRPKPSLEYTGQQIILRDNCIQLNFAATSGIYPYQRARYQDIKGEGPIPEGKYNIDLKPNPNRTADVIQEGESAGKLYNNVGIEKIPTDDPNWDFPGWGTIRARLEHVSGNNYDRDNFYLHDSNKGHTSGCIEANTNLLNMIIQYRTIGVSAIPVNVNYNSAATITGTDKGH